MHPFFRSPKVLKRALAALVLGVPLAVLLFLLARGKDLDARHRPLDFAESFDFDTGTLAAYEDHARERLRAAHPDADEEIIDNLAPFRMDPPAECPRSTSGGLRSGVVLTHDLQESPYTMRALGTFFQSSCFVVYGLLLPAHGARAGDLLDSGWQDWFAAQRFAARELGREVENLYLGGHGVGATLAMLEAATNASVDGLVLFAPRLDVQNPPWQAVAATILGSVFPPARWAEAVPATTPYRDGSRPWRLLAETNGLVVSTLAALPEAAVEIPVFTVLSLSDAAVDTQAVFDYMAGRTHPLSRTFVFGPQDAAAALGMSVRNDAFPEYQQLSLSHLGLMIPGADPTFGREGSSRECGHYYATDSGAYARCIAGERDFIGEITPENVAQGVIQRMTYNPYIFEAFDELNKFIAPVGQVISRTPR